MKLPFANYVKAHHISRAALCAGALVAATVFFVVGAGLRLLWGPVSLGPLRGTLDGAIHQALPGITLDYDQAAIAWNRDQDRVNLVVLGTRLYDAKGRVVANAPEAAIGLAAAPFLQGKFVVKRITLIGVQFTLVHMKSGRIRLGSQKDDDGDDVIGRIDDMINAHGSNSSALESFAVQDAQVAIFDEDTGLHVTANHAGLSIRAKRGATGLDFNADVETSGRRGHVTAELTLPAGKGPILGHANITGVDLRGLGADAAMFAGVKKVPMTANASTSFQIASGGALASADFDIAAAGQIPFAAMKDKALHVHSLRLVGHYDGGKHHLSLDVAELYAREAHVALRGTGDFFLDEAGKLQRVHAELSGRNIALDMPGVFAGAVAYQSVGLSADYLVGPRQFHITKFNILAPGFALDGDGTVTLNDSGAPGLVAKAHIAAMPVRTLLHYWPLPLAPGARDWTDANIFAGTIGPLEAQTNFPPGAMDQNILPEDSLKLTFALKDVEGSYVQGLTHATGVAGTAILTGDTFKVGFTGGHVGALTVQGGTALIPALHLKGTVGQFNTHIDGAMSDVMTLIDMKPLNYATKFGIDPKTTGGVVSADLAFKVPMLANLPMDAVGISVKAAVNGFAVSLGSHTRITEGAVHFDIDNAHLHQTGIVNLADARMTVDWSEDFQTQNPVTTRLAMKGIMTDAGRSALNVHLDRYLHGPTPIVATVTGHRGSLTHVDAMVDFTPATLSVPIVNLEKAPGQAASGHIVTDFAAGNILRNESIRITGPVLNTSGTARFGRDGELTMVSFPSFKMGPLNDLSFLLTHGPGGDDYTLRGRSMDGTRFGRNGSNEAPSASAVAAPQGDASQDHFHISAKLDRLAMRDGVTITPFNLDLTGIGNRPASLMLGGTLTLAGKTTPLAAGLDNNSTGRRITLTAGDAGLLARGLFGFDSMRGGALSVAVNLSGRAGDAPAANNSAPDFTGALSVKNFQVVDQPLLARLFSAGSFTGLSDLMDGDGMTMEELNMPFTAKNNVISINDARAVGHAIGASADGYIDRPKGTIALKGSLVPAYGINSFISNVPLLGDILASKKGEGIFGITYSLSGNSDHPDLSTNPLSMLTPGILRRIFEGHIPTAENAPSNAPASK